MILRGIGRRVERVAAPPARSTDARLADDPARRRADARAAVEAALNRRLHRRVVLAVLTAVFLAGGVTALFGKGGYFELRRLRRERVELQADVDLQRARLLALRHEVEALATDPMARERIAREELGLARPGEITYILAEPEPPEPAEPGSGDAKKRSPPG